MKSNCNISQSQQNSIYSNVNIISRTYVSNNFLSYVRNIVSRQKKLQRKGKENWIYIKTNGGILIYNITRSDRVSKLWGHNRKLVTQHYMFCYVSKITVRPQGVLVVYHVSSHIWHTHETICCFTFVLHVHARAYIENECYRLDKNILLMSFASQLEPSLSLSSHSIILISLAPY